MRRKNTETVGEALKDFFDNNRFLAHKLAESRVISGWQSLLGTSIASYTTGLYLKNGVLYVSLSSSVLRSELSMAKDRLILKLNDVAGLTIVKEIIFR